MLKTVILYSTVDGQTQAICQRIGQVLAESGEQTSLVNLASMTPEQLVDVDKVVIGASIRYGKHRPELFKFVEQHKDLLDSKLTSFFTVNVVARKALKNTPETNPYMQKFLTLSAWTPKMLGVFAGKIDYPRYRFFDKVKNFCKYLLFSGMRFSGLRATTLTQKKLFGMFANAC